MKKDSIKFFIDEIYSKPTKKIYPTNKILYNDIDEDWSFVLADFSDYKTSNNKGFRYNFLKIGKFSNCLWAIPLKKKNSQTITQEFSTIISTSKRSPVNLESDRGADFYNSIFQKLLKSKSIQLYSRFTDKGPSVAERVVKTIRNLIKKQVFGKRTANWLSELLSVVKNYNNTIHHSTKMKPIDASLKKNEKEIYSNLQDKRKRFNPKIKLAQLIRTADFRKVFSRGDSTNYSYNLHKNISLTRHNTYL